MITGDNAQCAHYIGTACGMIDADRTVYLAEATGHSVVWRRMGTDRTAPANVSSCQEETPISTENILSLVQQGGVELAMTGKSFGVLRQSSELGPLLLHTRIFARMTPNDKITCVALHNELGVITGMCGDGGNDCGALRAAHVGLSLSDAEASVVSPFTSKRRTVQSVVDLIREGKSALATSFAGYKFLIMYGQLVSMLKLACFYHGVICLCGFCSLCVDSSV